MRTVSLPSLRHSYALDDADFVQWYCPNEWTYCNKCDTPFYYSFLRLALEQETADKLFYFVVGTHDGTDIERMLAQPWGRNLRLHVAGWEVSEDNFVKAQQRLAAHSNVELTNRGVSNVTGVMTAMVGGGETNVSETSGLIDCGRPGATAFCASKFAVQMRVESWADVMRQRSIREVTYALVDVEGHEEHVLRGMRLEQNAAAFPMFQIELGGTWSDFRHAGVWSEADAASYLEALGYRLYLIGAIHRKGHFHPHHTYMYSPALLPVRPSHFTAVKCLKWLNQKPGSGVQGNLLAVHSQALSRKPWLSEFIENATHRALPQQHIPLPSPSPL